jgi:hypothetical protein
MVEIPVACYKLPDESYHSYLSRCDFFSKDYLYKVVLPYPDREGVRSDNFWESDYQVERRQRQRAVSEGRTFSQPDYSDRRYLPISKFLITRNGYYWDNIVVDRAGLTKLKGQLLSLLSPPPLDISRDFQDTLEAGGHQIPPHPATKTHSKVLGSDYPVTKFGHVARRKMQSAGYVFDQLCQRVDQPPNAVFLTLTLPGSTDEAIRTLAGWTGYISNRLFQVVRDCEKSNDITLHWLKAWEWQKRGALHLHLVLGADSTVSHNILLGCAKAIKDKWHDILLSFYSLPVPRPVIKFGGRVGCMPIVDMYERKNAKPGQIKTWRNYPNDWQDKIESVKKSVGRYLSKYTGKSKELLGNIPSILYYPSRWYGFSRILHDSVASQTIDIRCELNSLTDTAFRTFVEDLISTLKPLSVRADDFVVTKAGRVISGHNRVSAYLSTLVPSSSEGLLLLSGKFLSAFSTIPYAVAMEYVSARLSRLTKSIAYSLDISKTFSTSRMI